MKLNQVIALVSGKKTKAYKEFSDLYKQIQKPGLFDGMSRTYHPNDEEGEKLPPENKRVQLTVNDVLNSTKELLTDFYNLAATQDLGNCKAMVDVKVGDTVVLSSVPVTYLLFLEKQLNDLASFVDSLPALDPSETWTYSGEVGHYTSSEQRSNRTKKVLRNHVKADATEKHPAQVEVYTEDTPVGQWAVKKFSGAISADDKRDLSKKVRELQDAVKVAREEANSQDVTPSTLGKQLFDYLF